MERRKEKRILIKKNVRKGAEREIEIGDMGGVRTS